MKEFEFTTFLTSNIDIGEDELQKLSHTCRSVSLKKGDFLLREGETCKHAFFVEKGMVREYSIDAKGREHLLLFAAEGWFLTNAESVYFDLPSDYFIQAMEDARVLLIEQTSINRLSEQHPSFASFNTRLLHSRILHLQTRVTQLLSASAEERYLAFIKAWPYLPLRVPQAQIASYLGITPESLSRVRKELAEKNYRPPK